MQYTYRGYLAQGAVGANRIVKQGTVPQSCVQATGPTDLLIGTTDSLAKAVGEVADVAVGALGEVVLGGTIARGEPITSDASAAGVKAAPAAGANVRIIGFADANGVANDVIVYRVAPGVLQG